MSEAAPVKHRTVIGPARCATAAGPLSSWFKYWRLDSTVEQCARSARVVAAVGRGVKLCHQLHPALRRTMASLRPMRCADLLRMNMTNMHVLTETVRTEY
jgi:hypothetical protein